MRALPFHPRAPLCVAIALAAAACGDAELRPRQASPVSLAQSFAPAPAGAQPPQAVEAAPQPKPVRPRDAMPPIIRGLYTNAYVMGDPRRRAKLLALADSTEINAFVVDVKDEDGVRYRSALPLAREVAHERSIPIRDLAALVDTLEAHGIHPIARVVVFKDPRLSKARPAWSIQTPDGGLWRDKVGNTWVSPWDREVWDYNLDIAEEAVRAGFREVQFDYVRFPEAYRSLPRQVHPEADTAADRTAAIAGFLEEAGRRLRPLGATVTADLFGLSMNEATDVGIGQQWERISSRIDHVLPMVYPSHYFPTHLAGVPRPNRMPYETVFRSVGMGVIRNRRLAEAGVEPARIVPWLQAFTATWNDRGYPYGPEQLRAQLRAVYDLGLDDWILWHPGSNYDAVAAGFERETAGRAKLFDPPAPLSAAVDRFDREGAAKAREGVAAVGE
ncbi:MAG TPA: putative glycoside hydrolase [Longimicrobium sp.]|nr:putative glycoside hydrolase [Longimicrobium sp.]